MRRGGRARVPHRSGQRAGQANTIRTTAIASTPCNGTYAIRITFKLKGKGLIPVSDSGITLNGEVKIVAPPGNVDPGSGSIEGGAVALSWPALSPAPPDLTGYRVYRIDGDDATKLGEVGRNERTYTDSIPPAAGGKVTYQVKAVRAAPGQDVESLGGGKIVVDGVPVGSTTSTTTETGGGGGGGAGGTDGGGTAGGGGGGTAGTDGGATSTTKPGKTKTGGGRTFKPLGRGQVGVGTKAPRLGTPSGSNLEGLQTEDNGFDEELDYGDGLASEWRGRPVVHRLRGRLHRQGHGGARGHRLRVRGLGLPPAVPRSGGQAREDRSPLPLAAETCEQRVEEGHRARLVQRVVAVAALG